MPYCGRPSPGCQTCRQRKIKCDRAKPDCKNCTSARWRCPGYRNAVDLLFRDESAKVFKKFEAAKEKPKEKQWCNDVAKPHYDHEETEPVARDGGIDANDSDLVSTSPEVALAYNLDEVALGFFFHYYVVARPTPYDTWISLQSNDCLMASVIALGAAGVTKSGTGPSCTRQAQLRYSEAIRLTNIALHSPSDVKKDSTLLAINLLGHFEAITGYQRTLISWRTHVHGAAALLQYRGATQFETAEGGRLFMHTISSLLTSCLGRRFPIPSHIHKLATMAASEIPNAEDKIWRTFCLNLRFACLYAKLLPHNIPRSPCEAESIIKEALCLDRDMVALLNESSDDWYCLKAQADGPMVFDGCIYAYPHVLTSQQYNGLLYKRIIIQDIMLKALRTHPDPGSIKLCDSALRHICSASKTIHELQLDILASIPQYLGTSFSNSTTDSRFSKIPSGGLPRDPLWTNFMMKDQNPWRTRRTQTPRLPTVRSFIGYNVHWPLYVAGAADAANGKIRLWVINILRFFAQSRGLQQASLLANALEACEGEQLNAHLEYSDGIEL